MAYKPKGTRRPILTDAALRGARTLLNAVPSSIYLTDPDATAAARWLARYLDWHDSPAQRARRAARGEAIKNYTKAKV